MESLQTLIVMDLLRVSPPTLDAVNVQDPVPAEVGVPCTLTCPLTNDDKVNPVGNALDVIDVMPTEVIEFDES